MRAIAASIARGKGPDVFQCQGNKLRAPYIVFDGVVSDIDEPAHGTPREGHGGGAIDLQSVFLPFLANAEHAASLVNTTEHVTVQHEAEAAEHALFLDVSEVLNVGAQDLGNSFVISHCDLPLSLQRSNRNRPAAHFGKHIMAQPTFILIRPQMGENIGAAARAMWNFGLDRMRITSPRDGWPNQKAVAMASGAGRLLDEARLCETTAEAVGDTHFVYATTARQRDLTKPVFTPEAAMQDAAKRIAKGEQVAVLFGPERAGLENDDIVRANAIISVPVNPDFPSLNLAQCVLLTAYEWRRATTEAPGEVLELAGGQMATGIEVEKLAQHYEDRLDEAGFFFPAAKSDGMKQTLRNLWSRMPMTRADVQILHGILRQLVRWKEKG